MKSKFETWFTQQYFYNQLKYIHGDRLFDFDDGVGYRNLSVQIGYVAFCGRDVEFVFGGAQIAKNKPESIAVDGFRGGGHVNQKQSTLAVGQRVKVDFISESQTEFSGKRFCGKGTIDRYEDDRVFGRLGDGRPFVCMPSDVEAVRK